MRRAARYSSVVNEGLFVKYLGGRTLRFLFDYVGVARHLDRHQMEFCMAVAVRLARELTGLHLLATRVTLVHHRNDDCTELAAFFGCAVEAGAGADEIALAASSADVPLASADPFLNRLLIANCEEALARRSARQRTFRSTVENAIVPLLPHGRARAGEIAEQLGLSERTFARRLGLEGLTFSEVLEALRADLARQYLTNNGLSVSQVAWLLGYQEVSAFTHAFKRWTGRTPREARARDEAAPRSWSRP
jgi:AraC-like DNA-binding protein